MSRYTSKSVGARGRRRLCLGAVLALGACDGSPAATDAGAKPPGADVVATDAPKFDVGAVDAPKFDVGAVDAPNDVVAQLDATAADGGAADANALDAETNDVAIADVTSDDATADVSSDGATADVTPVVVSQEVGPAGGTVAAPGLSLVIPPGALVVPQTVRVTARADGGGAYRYEFGPAGLTFAIAAQATVTLPTGTGAVRPVLSARDGNGFTSIGATREGDTLTLLIPHFSNLCVRADCPAPTMVSCGGAMVDIGVSNAHCGGCDRPCPMGTQCRATICEGVPSTPSATLADLDGGVGRYAHQRSCDPVAGEPTPAGCGLQPVTGGRLALVPGPGSRTFPTHETALRGDVVVPAFTMDRHEVTVGRFRRFWNDRSRWSAANRTVPHPWGKTFYYRQPSYFPTQLDDFWRAPREPGVACSPSAMGCTQSCNWTPTPGDREDHPINCIDWFTLLQFCMWDGGENPTGRLPTEFEMQYAAQGPLNANLAAGRRWPWGDAAPTCGARDASGANLANCFADRPDAMRTYDPMLRRPGTVPVGSYVPNGLEPPFFDLVGNVREWTADVIQWVPFNANAACLIGDFNIYRPGVAPSQQCFIENFADSVIRGSSFDDSYNAMRLEATDITVRSGAFRPTQFASIGGRCARGPLAECGNAVQPCCATPMGGMCRPGLRCDTSLRDPLCLPP